MTLPEGPPGFYWTDETWGAALRCRALDPIAQHLFTTRQLQVPAAARGGARTRCRALDPIAQHLFTTRQLQLPAAEAWRALAAVMGVPVDRVVSLNQVHGREVAVVGGDVPRQRPDADALVSNRPDVALVVRAADCVPLLIGDSRTGAVGAVHAGWRGTAARVAVGAVEAMG